VARQVLKVKMVLMVKLVLEAYMVTLVPVGSKGILVLKVMMEQLVLMEKKDLEDIVVKLAFRV
jgi:hypothetical protein